MVFKSSVTCLVKSFSCSYLYTVQRTYHKYLLLSLKKYSNILQRKIGVILLSLCTGPRRGLNHLHDSLHCGLDQQYPAQAHMIKTMSPEWPYWEVAKLLRGRT